MKTLNAKINIDVSDFQSSMKSMFALISKLAKEIRNAAKKMDFDTSGFDKLDKEIDNAVKDFKKLGKSIDNVGDKTEKAQKGFSGLGSTLGKLTIGAGMVAGAAAVVSFTNDISALQKQIKFFSDESGKNLESLTARVQATAQTFGKENEEIMIATNNMAKGFDISFSESLEILQDGFLAGADASDELLDIVKEYPALMQEAGLGADRFMALITQQVKDGIYSDKGVDAVKEFMLRIREMTPAVNDALAGIGMSGTQIQAELQSGSKNVYDVLKEVTEEMGKLPESSDKIGTALADLFGGAGEDASLKFLLNIKNIDDGMKGMIDTQDEFTKKQMSMLEIRTKINEVFGQLATSLSPIINELLGVITSSILPLITELAKSLFPVIQKVFAMLSPLISILAETLIPVINQIFEELEPIFEQLGELIAAILPPILSLLTPIFAILKPIINIVSTLLDVLTPIITSLVNSLVPAITEILNVVAPLVTIMANMLNEIMIPYKPVLIKLADLLGVVLVKSVKILLAMLTGLLGGLDSGTGATNNYVEGMKILIDIFGVAIDVMGTYYNWILDITTGALEFFGLMEEKSKKAPIDVANNYEKMSKKVEAASSDMLQSLVNEMKFLYDSGQLTAAEWQKLTQQMIDTKSEIEKPIKVPKIKIPKLDPLKLDTGSAIKSESELQKLILSIRKQTEILALDLQKENLAKKLGFIDEETTALIDAENYTADEKKKIIEASIADMQRLSLSLKVDFDIEDIDEGLTEAKLLDIAKRQAEIELTTQKDKLDKLNQNSAEYVTAQEEYNKLLSAQTETLYTELYDIAIDAKQLQEDKILEIIEKSNKEQIKLTEDAAVIKAKLEKEERERLKATYTELAETFAQITEDVISGQRTLLQAFVIMALDSLEKMFTLWSVEILMKNLATPTSIASFGAAGFAQWALLHGIVKGILAAAKSAVARKEGGWMGAGHYEVGEEGREFIVSHGPSEKYEQLLSHINKGGDPYRFMKATQRDERDFVLNKKVDKLTDEIINVKNAIMSKHDYISAEIQTKPFKIKGNDLVAAYDKMKQKEFSRS